MLPFTLILCAFIVLSSNYFGRIQIYSKSRCSLEPKSFPRRLYPPKIPDESLSTTIPQSPPSSVDARCACFSSDVYSMDHVFYLDMIKQHETNLSAKKSNVALLHMIVTDIKENIITKLQKLYNPPRKLRAGNKSPALFLKKPQNIN